MLSPSTLTVPYVTCTGAVVCSCVVAAVAAAAGTAITPRTNALEMIHGKRRRPRPSLLLRVLRSIGSGAAAPVDWRDRWKLNIWVLRGLGIMVWCPPRQASLGERLQCCLPRPAGESSRISMAHFVHRNNRGTARVERRTHAKRGRSRTDAPYAVSRRRPPYHRAISPKCRIQESYPPLSGCAEA